MLERGKVTYLNKIKKYGFISLENGKQVFFHISTGKKVSITREPQPGFINPTQENPVIFPKLGEKIIFMKHTNAKGTLAVYWAYANTYDNAVKFIADRANE